MIERSSQIERGPTCDGGLAQTLVDRATSSTGLDDFGMDGWQVGLEHLVDAVARDLGANPSAIEWIEDTIVGRLTNRLEVEAWYGSEGGERTASARRALGDPRTPEDGDHGPALSPERGPAVPFVPACGRWLRRYLPLISRSEATDPRRSQMAGRSSDARHISSVDGPTEDVFIQALHFGSQEMSLPVPTYSAWWREADLLTTYAYQERVLRLLHSHRPPYRWLLKSPSYLFHVPELHDHYPSARFVMTHRDPTSRCRRPAAWSWTPAAVCPASTRTRSRWGRRCWPTSPRVCARP